MFGSSKKKLSAVFAVLVFLGTSAPIVASSDMAFRAQGQSLNSDGDPLGLGNDFGSSAGIYLGLEKRLSPRLGVEIGAAWTELEQSFSQDLLFAAVDISSSLRVIPVTVALDIHLTPQSRFDLYLAPKIGYAFFDDYEISTQVSFGGLGGFQFGDFAIPLTFDDPIPSTVQGLGVEDQFIYGLRLGYDVPLGSSDSWILSTSIDYLAMELELAAAQGASTDLDPLSLGLGVTYRF